MHALEIGLQMRLERGIRILVIRVDCVTMSCYFHGIDK